MPLLPQKEGDESGETAQSKPLPRVSSWAQMESRKKTATDMPFLHIGSLVASNAERCFKEIGGLCSSSENTSGFDNEFCNDCPPDVEQLGRSSWTLLHAITATYPIAPSQELQKDTRQFISSFSKLYPCWTCASDFQQWLKEDGNAPRVSSRDEFGRWMCEAHNAVNVKLGKQNFDCNRWEERWRTGWKDGRCD